MRAKQKAEDKSRKEKMVAERGREERKKEREDL